jgi:FdhD protein
MCNLSGHPSRQGSAPRTITAEYNILDITEYGSEERPVEVSVEDSVCIHINGARIATMSITPEDLEAFAYGYPVCEGMVQGIREIRSVQVDLPDIRIAIPGFDAGTVARDLEIGSSGGINVPVIGRPLGEPAGDGIRISLETLFTGMQTIHRLSKTWSVTGGTHSAIVLDDAGTLVSWAEDMGRHNSVDKAVGKALLSGADLSRCFLVCTGRMPAGMIAKAYRAGFSLIVSNTAPFSAGIDLARKLNLTLAGFVRPPRAMIYSVPGRIILPRSLARH